MAEFTKPLQILVLCTGNSARSILAEALLNHLGAGRVQAYSAGSKPTGVVNPVALTTLAKHGIACAAARSKSWDEFAEPPTAAIQTTVAPALDYVITVCGNAADEVCPIWRGTGAGAGAVRRIHWGIADPAHIEPLAAKEAAFELAYQALHQRVTAFLALPLASMEAEAVVAAAQEIHHACQAKSVNAAAKESV